jgi:hypothetical protein
MEYTTNSEDPIGNDHSPYIEILVAGELRSDELKKATYENLNLKYDKSGVQLVRGGVSEMAT